MAVNWGAGFAADSVQLGYADGSSDYNQLPPTAPTVYAGTMGSYSGGLDAEDGKKTLLLTIC